MKQKILLLTSLCISSVLLVIFISKVSAHRNRYNNDFNRLFPPKVTGLPVIHNLDGKGFYFAGADSNRVYLGNVSRPGELTIVNVLNGELEKRLIRQNDPKLMVTTAMRIRILPPYFFLMDGSRPFIIRGKLKDLYADYKLDDKVFFVDALPLDSITFALRSLNSKAREFMMVRLSAGKPSETEYIHTILEKQVDGLFCVDGIIQFDSQFKKLVYVYRFRNQYIQLDRNLRVLNRSNTIDTISHAAIKVFYEKSTGNSYLAAPPLTVNKNSALHGKHLFVNSNLMARNEEKRLFGDASVIDVYDTTNNIYKFSFYLYDYMNIKARDFLVAGNYLVALHDNHLLVYKFTTTFT